MKYYFLLCLISLVSCQNEKSFRKAAIIPSKIDSLTNYSEIENLIHSLDSNTKYFKLQKIEKFYSRFTHQKNTESLLRDVAAKNGISKAFYKFDFDNNCYQDMLVIGDHKYCGNDTLTCDYDTFVIMNFENDSLSLKRLLRSHSMPIIPHITNHNENVFINAYEVKYNYEKNDTKPSLFTTPLLFKFDNFIEYNPKPAKHNIERVEYAAGPCFGRCPMFQINIEDNGNACFIAQHYNFSDKSEDYRKEEGVFRASIKNVDYSKITELLNYIDFKNLDDQYWVSWTDSASSTLIITYDGGKIKKIEDYGQIGTYGLIAVYDLFKKLRFNQDWKPTKEFEGIRINNF